MVEINIREIAFDRWGAVQMVQNLEGKRFTVVPFGQDFKDMSPPTKELMKLTFEEKITPTPRANRIRIEEESYSFANCRKKITPIIGKI